MESQEKPQTAGRKPLSATTRKIYADDWVRFRAWCHAQSLPDLPALPATVVAYLIARQGDLGISGLRIVLAAIAFHHRQAGLPWSAADPVIATVLRGIAQARPRPVRSAMALTPDDVHRLLGSCDVDPGGKAGLLNLRDRALLSVCFAGGLRRSELVALDREDLDIASDGMVLRIRDPRGEGQGEAAALRIARRDPPDTCPVRAMELWLRRARIEYGAVFPRLSAAGTIETRLTGNGVWKILRRRAGLAGLDIPAGERLSPHGLRAGFITQAYGAGAGDSQVMSYARKKDAGTTRRYRQRAGAKSGSTARVMDL